MCNNTRKEAHSKEFVYIISSEHIEHLKEQKQVHQYVYDCAYSFSDLHNITAFRPE